MPGTRASTDGAIDDRIDGPIDEMPATPTVEQPREASARTKRRTLVAIGLLTLPIIAAMVYGVVGRATSDGTSRGPATVERTLLSDDADKGSALGPAIAITALGVVVACCVAVPLVRARRRATAAATTRPGATTGADAGERAGTRAGPGPASSARTPRR